MTWTPDELRSIQEQAARAIDALHAPAPIEEECFCQCHETGAPCATCEDNTVS